MNKKIIVTKASGLTEPFSILKLRNSLTRAKASPEEINGIVEILLPKLYQGISTKKIYSEAFRLLREYSKHHAARYYLKRGMMELGPSGYPFENFVGELFKHQGYAVEVGLIMQGKCVTHEIDVSAKRENQFMLMECKYRNQPGISVDVKTPLYIYSRFQDLLDNSLLKNEKQSFVGWIVTNAKFTTDAIAYGSCKSMNLLGWNYPINNSLKDMIDKFGLYPLTCLTSLTHHEKQWLLTNNYVLAKDIYNKENILRKAGVKEIRMKAVLEEGAKLCASKD